MTPRIVLLLVAVTGCATNTFEADHSGSDDPLDIGRDRDPGPGPGDPREPGVGGDPASDLELDAFLDAEREAGQFPGLSAALVVDGQMVWSGAYGWADIENHVAATPDTLFMVASLSNTVVATAAMQLVEWGLIGLDDDVGSIVGFPVGLGRFAGRPITLRHLLTHTSTIWDDWDALDATFVEGDNDVPLGNFLFGYLRDDWHYWSEPPGTAYDFSNVGIALAAYAVEAASGERFDQATTDSVFKPLGMTETSWTLAGLDIARVAVPYAPDGRALAHYGYAEYPSGSLRTSAPQLARLLAAYAGGGQLDGVSILEPASVDEIEREQMPATAPDQCLGWYIEDDGYGRLLSHAGWDYGVASLMSLRPRDGVGTILLTNGNWDLSPDALYVMQERLFREAERF